MKNNLICYPSWPQKGNNVNNLLWKQSDLITKIIQTLHYEICHKLCPVPQNKSINNNYGTEQNWCPGACHLHSNVFDTLIKAHCN